MTALVPVSKPAIPSQREAVRMYAQAMRVTGTDMVPKDQRNNTDAIVATMLAGWEQGLSPMQSLRSYHIIEGKPSESAELLMTLARRAGIDIFVAETTNESCTVEVRHPDWPDDRVGSVTFTYADAEAAGLTNKSNWKNYPRSMLRSRAVTEAVRAHCPEVTVGASYTPEELGVEVDGMGIPAGRGPEFLADADADVVEESIEVLDRDSAALEAKAKAAEEDRDPELDDFLDIFDPEFLATQDLDAMREWANEDQANLSRTLAVLEKRQAEWEVKGPEDEQAEDAQEDATDAPDRTEDDGSTSEDEGEPDPDQPPPPGYYWHKGSGHYYLYDEDQVFTDKVRGQDNVPVGFEELDAEPDQPEPEDDDEAEEQDEPEVEEVEAEVIEDGEDSDDEPEPDDVVDAEVISDEETEWPGKVQVYDAHFMVPDRDHYEGGIQAGRRRAHEFVTHLLDLEQEFAEHLDNEGNLGKSIQFAAISQENLDKLLDRLEIRHEHWKGGV